MIKDCEICFNSFPIDCFEFLPCFHKLCVFCYNDIKKSNIILNCPFCRTEINNSDIGNISSSNHNNFINDIPNEEEDYDEYYNNYNEEYYINKISKKHKQKYKIKRQNYSEKFNNL